MNEIDDEIKDWAKYYYYNFTVDQINDLDNGLCTMSRDFDESLHDQIAGEIDHWISFHKLTIDQFHKECLVYAICTQTFWADNDKLDEDDDDEDVCPHCGRSD